MSSDSIEQILNDCTMSPKAYCMLHDCGQGIYDELADYVPDMCINLVGRTEAVMRHTLLTFCDSETSNKFHIGDRVMRDNGSDGTVIGFAMGEDGNMCLVLSMQGDGWKTYLCPISEARHLKVPTFKEVREEIQSAIQEASSGNDLTPYDAELKADYLTNLAHACFTHSEFPMQ